jgi:hypothetical protein
MLLHLLVIINDVLFTRTAFRVVTVEVAMSVAVTMAVEVAVAVAAAVAATLAVAVAVAATLAVAVAVAQWQCGSSSSISSSCGGGGGGGGGPALWYVCSSAHTAVRTHTHILFYAYTTVRMYTLTLRCARCLHTHCCTNTLLLAHTVAHTLLHAHMHWGTNTH